nr:MAG TPA: hypothetical protein [Caudoviricetes sp.]
MLEIVYSYFNLKEYSNFKRIPYIVVLSSSRE